MTDSDNSKAVRLEEAMRELERSLNAWTKDSEAGTSALDFGEYGTPDAQMQRVGKYVGWLPVHIYLKTENK